MPERGGKSFGHKSRNLSKGGGLSLAKFAGAKKSTYDPREVKERQRAQAAITVAKYRKLKAKLQRTSNILPGQQQGGDGGHAEDEEGTREDEKRSAAAGPSDSWQRRADAEIEREGAGVRRRNGKGEDDLEKERLREEAAAQAAIAAAKKEAAAKKRRAEQKVFRKKTHHGQPLMKHRIEKMLHQLEKE